MERDMIGRAACDGQLTPWHIALLTGILFFSGGCDEMGFFQVSRKKLKSFSKIRANATYHKCLSDLVQMGYVEYLPSYDPLLGSRMKLVNAQNV